jgi:hypothetical protein
MHVRLEEVYMRELYIAIKSNFRISISMNRILPPSQFAVNIFMQTIR